MDLATLFLWSFLAATILPLGSEPALAAIVHRRDAVSLPLTVATLGNYLGACTTYALAMTASKAVKCERALRRMERASEFVRRYGASALLLSWVPLIERRRDVFHHSLGRVDIRKIYSRRAQGAGFTTGDGSTGHRRRRA